MPKLLPLLIAAFIIAAGCKKSVSTPGSSGLTDVKYIIITTGDSTGSGITCINPGKTTRWVRKGLAQYLPTWVYYSDGVIYAPYSEYNYTTAEGHGNFYAIDAATGKDIWAIKHSGDIYYNVYRYNGTLYAYVQTVAGFYLAALDAATGKQQWRVPINVSWVTDFKADGNTLYFYEDISNTNISLTAFNLTTKTIAWQTKTNKYTNTYKGLIIKDGYLYVPGLNGAVSAIDKATGKVAWTAPGASITGLINSGSTMYYVNSGSQLCALNLGAGNGVLNWQQPAVDSNAHVHLAGNSLYVTGRNITGPKYVAYAASAADGSVQWQQTFSNLVQYPVAVGGNLYVYDNTAKTILVLDEATGKQKDAIPLNASSKGYCEIVTSDGTLVTPD